MLDCKKSRNKISPELWKMMVYINWNMNEFGESADYCFDVY